MLDAAALAAILDPERKVPGWWSNECPSCPGSLGYGLIGHHPQCPQKHDGNLENWEYQGPDLHTAREHAWRLEEWLEARGFNIHRVPGWTYVYRDKRHHPKVYEDANHTAALVAAIERIANG